MRIAHLCLAFLVVSSTLEAAPAPQPKGLPEEIQVLLKHYTHGYPYLIENIHRKIQRTRSEEDRERYIRDMEQRERDVYRMPVKVLEDSLGDARYPRREDQDAIRAALTKYRARYEDAKMRKLFKPEPPPAPGKAPR